MKIEQEHFNHQHIFHLNGNLALGEVKKVRSLLKDFTDDPSVKKIILNMKSVKSIDSTGLGMIVNYYNQMKKRDAQLIVCCLNESLRHIFKVTQLDSVLMIAESAESAVG